MDYFNIIIPSVIIHPSFPDGDEFLHIVNVIVFFKQDLVNMLCQLTINDVERLNLRIINRIIEINPKIKEMKETIVQIQNIIVQIDNLLREYRFDEITNSDTNLVSDSVSGLSSLFPDSFPSSIPASLRPSLLLLHSAPRVTNKLLPTKNPFIKFIRYLRKKKRITKYTTIKNIWLSKLCKKKNKFEYVFNFTLNLWIKSNVNGLLLNWIKI
jgi:hypothetical protein